METIYETIEILKHLEENLLKLGYDVGGNYSSFGESYLTTNAPIEIINKFI